MDLNNEKLSSTKKVNQGIPHIRDKSTPDIFHNLTDNDIQQIAITLCSYSYIRKRHKVVDIEVVKKFILDSLEKYPELYQAFQKIRKTKPKVPNTENPLRIDA